MRHHDQGDGGHVGGLPRLIDELALKDRALDAAAEGITIADARLRDRPLIYVNDGFERLTGYRKEEVLGRNCRFLQGAGTDLATASEIRRALETERECVVEILNYRKDGSPFWNRLSITPLKDETGRVSHFIGVQSDITTRKIVEEELNIANARLEEANRRFRQDLEMAARIQGSFLPGKQIHVRGAEVAWELRSCTELAGDTLNVVPLDERHVEFYIIDVSGHGVPAALLSVTLNHVLSPVPIDLLQGLDRDLTTLPVDMVERLNQQFPFDHERSQFFTLIYGIYDTEDRLFRFVSAGHPALLHVSHSGHVRDEWVEGIPVGILPDTKYEQNTIQLAPGDRIYLYSDGLIEVFDRQQEPYGLERLKQALKRARAETLKGSITAVIEEAENWGRGAPFEDDVSLLAFEVK